MKLRIVTATRGQSPFLGEMLASVRAIPGAIEHVIVCPPSAVEALAAQVTNARVVPETGAGLYAALNQGWREPPGDWDAFTWINDDDRLVAPGFAGVVAKVERDPQVEIAYGRVDLIDGRGAPVGGLPVANRPDDLAALFARGIIPFAQPGTIIRRRICERLGGFDEGYRVVGDMDFFVRALATGAKFAFVDVLAASFRLRAGQLSKRPDVAAETARALRRLGGTRGSAAALVRFRLANWRNYFDRIRRHGFVSMRELYDRTA